MQENLGSRTWLDFPVNFTVKSHESSAVTRLDDSRTPSGSVRGCPDSVRVSGLNFLATAFEKLTPGLDDLHVEPENDEPPPPGFEDNHKTMPPSAPCKLQCSRLPKRAPKIEQYVARAMCRQRLHHDVLEQWKSILGTFLWQFLMSRFTSKKHSGKKVFISFVLFQS